MRRHVSRQSKANSFLRWAEDKYPAGVFVKYRLHKVYFDKTPSLQEKDYAPVIFAPMMLPRDLVMNQK